MSRSPAGRLADRGIPRPWTTGRALRPALFFLAVFAFSPLLAYEYREVVGTVSPLHIYARPSDSSRIVTSVPSDRSMVFLDEKGEWIEVATPDGDRKGWVRSDDTSPFSAPEVYEFSVNRDRMVELAKEFLAQQGRLQGKNEAADTSFSFVGSVFGKYCESGKTELILVSFKQPVPGERINVYLEQTLGGVKALKASLSRFHTDWWELDDLRQSGLGCEGGK